MTVRIGTRGSALALTQARYVEGILQESRAGIDISIVVIKTKGDSIVDRSIPESEAKGLFVKEIEQALLAGEIDVAAHSMKDMPTALSPELMLACVRPRGDARDALISANSTSLKDLRPKARTGTSSSRRRAQLLAVRPDLKVDDIRGNVDTRLKRLDNGDYDALVLASCGIDRLGLSHRICERLPTETMLPAACQGIIAIESRAVDAKTNRLLEPIKSVADMQCATAERSFLAELQGGCKVPIAAFATIRGSEMRVEGLVATPDGKTVIRKSVSGESREADELGRQLSVLITREGGRELLNGYRSK